MNTRLPNLGPGSLSNYGPYAAGAAGMSSVKALRDAAACTNMRFEDGSARNAPGYAPVTMTPEPDGPINLIGQANLSNQLVSVYTRTPIIGTTASLFAQDSGQGYILVLTAADQVLNIGVTTTSLTCDYIDTYGTGENVPIFSWTQVSGPNTATLATPNAQTAAVSGLIAGTYQFQVSISDGGNGSSALINVLVL